LPFHIYFLQLNIHTSQEYTTTKIKHANFSRFFKEYQNHA
jgi:hypothetical protein